MELTTLKSHIKNKDFAPVYIFTGTEVEVMRIYLQQMAKAYSATIKGLDSIEQLSEKAHTRTVLQNRFIYTIRDSKEFLSDDKLQARITQNKAFSDAVLVFIYTAIDKRSKLYKNYQDLIVEFEPMRESVLIKYIQNVIDLNDKNCKTLIDICESDYSRILLEIDKVKRFGSDANKSFEQLLSDGTIYSPPRDAVFMFVDAVLRNKKKSAFGLLAESYESGEATLILLSNLYNSAKQVLQVQCYNGDNKITDATGLTPFQVKLASEKKNIYSPSQLVRLMKLTREAEKGIKTGEIEEMMAVSYVLVQLWN